MDKLRITFASRQLSLFVAIPLFVILAACAPQTPVTLNSGIQGQVLIGPTCPVVREGLDCADKPYLATLTVLTYNGKRVTQFQTGRDGKFRLSLSPGDYILHPETPQGKPLPRAPEQPFTVTEGNYTSLAVTYDSGIR